jgi:hypothetical protein
MTHALSIGQPDEVEGTHGLVCATCGYITYTDVSDEDAVWVLCGPCYRSSGGAP